MQRVSTALQAVEAVNTWLSRSGLRWRQSAWQGNWQLSNEQARFVTLCIKGNRAAPRRRTVRA